MGNVRDLPKLTKERYPIWCRGFNPVGVANNFTGNFPKKIMKEILSLYEGGIAVCDLTGVVAIKKKDYVLLVSLDGHHFFMPVVQSANLFCHGL